MLQHPNMAQKTRDHVEIHGAQFTYSDEAFEDEDTY